MVRETRAVWVLWNPERIPQATVRKKIGMKCPPEKALGPKYAPKSNPPSAANCPTVFQLSHTLISGYHFAKIAMKLPTAENTRIRPKIG